MPVAVFGQLDHLLRERNLTLADLKRQIEERYGLAVDLAALDKLTGRTGVRETDLRLIGAVTDILEIKLDDLLIILAIPSDVISTPSEPDFLSDEQSQRWRELQRLKGIRTLSKAERRELRSLVDEYGRLSGDYYRSRYAARRGITIEEAQREEDERLAEIVALQKWLDADPRNREQYLADAKRRIASASQ